MKRCIGLFLSILLIGLVAVPARAHDVLLLAAVTVKGDQISVRLLDQLASSIPGAKVTLGTGAPGQTPTRTVKAAEDANHVYTAKMTGSLPEVYQITVSAVITEMEFRTSVRARRGEDMAETMIPLVHIEKQPLFTWENMLYIAAAALLLVATAVALFKRRKVAPQEGDSKA